MNQGKTFNCNHRNACSIKKNIGRSFCLQNKQIRLSLVSNFLTTNEMLHCLFATLLNLFPFLETLFHFICNQNYCKLKSIGMCKKMLVINCCVPGPRSSLPNIMDNINILGFLL